MFLYSKNEIFTPYLRLYKYKDDNWRLVQGIKRKSGFEPINSSKEIENDIHNDIKYSEISSLSRTKRIMREIALCNDFKYFVTFTISSNSCDRFSLDKCQSLFHKLAHNYQRRCKYAGLDFKYIVITEKHDKGGYHFHGLVTELLPNDLFINNNGFLDSHFWSSNLGFFSASKIVSLSRCSNYIMKYITKKCVKNSHNQIYFCSRGLARAEVFDLPQEPTDFEKFKNFWSFENDYVKIRDFSFENIPKNLQVYLFQKT